MMIICLGRSRRVHGKHEIEVRMSLENLFNFHGGVNGMPARSDYVMTS